MSRKCFARICSHHIIPLSPHLETLYLDACRKITHVVIREPNAPRASVAAGVILTANVQVFAALGPHLMAPSLPRTRGYTATSDGTEIVGSKNAAFRVSRLGAMTQSIANYILTQYSKI